MNASTALLWVSVVLFLLAALPIPTSPFQIGWLGLFFMALSFALGR